MNSNTALLTRHWKGVKQHRVNKEYLRTLLADDVRHETYGCRAMKVLAVMNWSRHLRNALQNKARSAA